MIIKKGFSIFLKQKVMLACFCQKNLIVANSNILAKGLNSILLRSSYCFWDKLSTVNFNTNDLVFLWVETSIIYNQIFKRELLQSSLLRSKLGIQAHNYNFNDIASIITYINILLEECKSYLPALSYQEYSKFDETMQKAHEEFYKNKIIKISDITFKDIGKYINPLFNYNLEYSKNINICQNHSELINTKLICIPYMHEFNTFIKFDIILE